ncbi:GAF domain-containing protein [Nonomuraea sp. NPDC048882]|uniref:helix-turn-helix domain-containing protein n=1 Tax=Nonomuraea sp. NPDC048882 TaxID=3154347 RepID=UPI003401B9BE
MRDDISAPATVDGVSARSEALATVLGAVTGDGAVSPRDLGAALETLGVPAPRQEQAREHVHRAHSEHVRLRRREHELAALFASARELAAARDGKALLERLVQRAHEILGCDVTYLSEYDARTRELNVRTTAGAYSGEFRHLNVPAGYGLAGEVIELRMPRWVPRYSEYLADRRVPDIDRAVELEGVVSILGVPMVSGDDVLGVLFVATREERSFTPDQIALLSALADHASVVLRTAHTLRDLWRSEEEARAALERLTEHLAERDRAGAVHRELIQVVLDGGGFGQLVRALSSALGRGVTVIDAEDRVIAASGPAAPFMSARAGGPVELPPRVRAAVAAGARTGHCQVLAGADREMLAGAEHEVAAVGAMRAGAQDFGALLFGPGDFELGPVDRRTIERAAQVCSLLELQHQAVARAEGRLLTDLVADILDGQPGRRDDLERRARAFGVELSRLDTVQLYVVPGERRARALAAARRHVGAAGLAGLSHDAVVVLLDSRRPGAAPHALREHIARHAGGPVLAVVLPPTEPAGAGDPVEEAVAGLVECFTLALRTSRLLAVIGVDDEVAGTDDYLPYVSVFDADARSLTSYVTRLIGPVLDYDAERGTELEATLRAFARCNASPTRAARTLGFHPNTILQRLERLDALLGPGWREDDRFFRISLAVRLRELMSAAHRSSAHEEPGGLG